MAAAATATEIFLGADLDARRVGEIVGRVAAEDVLAAVEAITGTWESLRSGAETLGQTVNRLGADAFGAHIAAVMRDRWELGPEPTVVDLPAPAPMPARVAARAAG